MKRMTRGQVERWLDCARKPLRAIRRGEAVDAIDGVVMCFCPESGEYEPLSALIDGLLGCLRRLFPAYDWQPVQLLSALLEAGEDLTAAELDAALAAFNGLVKPLMRQPWAAVREAANQEMLLIALEDAA